MTYKFYRIRNLSDLLAIPPSAIPRLMEELPSIIDAIRDQGALGVKFDFIDWFDDGKPGLTKVYVNGKEQ